MCDTFVEVNPHPTTHIYEKDKQMVYVSFTNIYSLMFDLNFIWIQASLLKLCVQVKTTNPF